MNEREWHTGRLSRPLSLLGVAILVYGLVHSQLTTAPAWALVLAFGAGAVWTFRELTPVRWDIARGGAEVVMVAAGCFATAPTEAWALIPAIAGIVAAISNPQRNRYFGFALAAGGVLLVALGALTTSISPSTLLTTLAALLVGAMMGFSRRQSRAAEEQARALAEERMALREEHARSTVLAERSRMARDIHDVLAHSLGGLVIQLDAVEALLEAGDTAGAAVRIRDSRELAANGLAEARRAVDALREPDDRPGTDLAAENFVSSLTTLVSAETSLGSTVAFEESGVRRSLAASTASAVRRALQEALSNSRKHAPGQPVVARLDWQQDAVVLTVENSLPASAHEFTAHELAATGGGHGLAGMRERFDALPAGGRVAAGVEGRSFVVRAEGRIA